MDVENEQRESVAAIPLPAVPRLDRLDHLITLLEDNHKLLKKQDSNNANKGENADNDDSGDDERIKPVSTALEEVHFKGTLMDRIALLEQRVLQLSLLLMDTDNSCGSSSMRLPTVGPDTTNATMSCHGSSKESSRMQKDQLETQEVLIQDARRRPEQTNIVEMQGCGYRRWRTKTSTKNRKKIV